MRLLSRKWVVPFGLLVILVMAIAACDSDGKDGEPFQNWGDGITHRTG